MLNYIKSMLIISSVLILSSCASVPTGEKLQAEIANVQLPHSPERGKAMVYVVRPGIFGTIIKFNIFVDDKLPESDMGYTKYYEYIYFNLTPGNHKIFSRAENWAEINITAKEGDIIFLEQTGTPGIFFARNNIKQINESQGKYHMRRLTLGKIKRSDK